MGEAFDRTGAFLNSATGASKAEVLNILEDRHGKTAAEVRLRNLDTLDRRIERVIEGLRDAIEGLRIILDRAGF